ncbi:PP2C family protein-serine/threonine phosphatase [Allochromatium palmeri]|uniref:Serine/threonine-protein phosphatase n=1 Tax=Allochromatium palmeri TaxID=231048 RepID=A0A6N8EBA8_9GAMM|nr:protein phosphatase 2C domain-containing protein [Allochromatium palmeri]MTW19817.1 serine/threonine-protein phosphatase [Allochromatium palmeri]
MDVKPVSAFELDFVWRTDQGRVRQRNEDAVIVRPEFGLVVVADGVGGASAGDVASRLATETIAERFGRRVGASANAEKARLYLQAAVEEANITILRYARENRECTGMGTTVVVGAVGRDWLAFAHVGDSRLYRLRGEELVQLSRDHSFIQEVVDQGFFNTREDAKRYGIGENILTRALGSTPSVAVSSDVIAIDSGDLFLFCTDGLSGLVPDDWLKQILSSIEDDVLESAADALVGLANERGGNDNITLGLLRVGERVAV